MKKNRFLRIASVLLMLCLVTTCAVSGTFAKYTTSDSDEDTARVAKWGVTVAVDGTLFGTKYASNAAGSNQDSIVASSTNVASANTDNIVAPGTKNDTGFQILLKGKPEVAYKLGATTNGQTIDEIWLNAGTYATMVKVYGVNEATSLTNLYTYDSVNKIYESATAYDASASYYELKDNVEITEKYYPLTWNIAVNEVKDTGNVLEWTAPTDTTLNGITTAMINSLNTEEFMANDEVEITYKLTWSWNFNNTSKHTSADSLDTILGTLMAGNADPDTVVVKSTTGGYTAELTDGTDYNLDVAFGFALVATQID